jgi:PncC family amidohydrolase
MYTRTYDRGRDMLVSVAESLTGGLLADAFVQTPGASKVFAGGAVCYTLDAKCAVLGVPRSVAAPCDCVSPEVARAMARGCVRLFGTSYAIGTTGYAEPREREDGTTTPPIAYVSIYDRERDRFDDMVVQEDGARALLPPCRNAFRAEVARRAHARFRQYLPFLRLECLSREIKPM